MNDLALVVLIGGVAVGLAIIGLAYWIIRQDAGAGAAGATSEPAPADDAATAPSAAAEGTASGEAGPSESAAPPEPPEVASSSGPALAELHTPDLAGGPLAAPPATAQTESPPATPSADEAPPAGPPADEAEEVVQLRRGPDGSLMVSVNGQHYRHRVDIADAGLDRKLLALLNDFAQFMSGSQPLIAAHPTKPEPEPADPPQAPQLVDGRLTVVMSAEEAARVPLVMPSMDILQQYRYLRAREKQPQVKFKSVLEEVDEIVKAKIGGTALAGRGLRVSASKDGSALFSIDGTSYEALELMPDAEARELVQAAIEEWERRQR